MRWLVITAAVLASGAAIAREHVWGNDGSDCVWGTRRCTVTGSGITGVAGQSGMPEWGLMVWGQDRWGQ